MCSHTSYLTQSGSGAKIHPTKGIELEVYEVILCILFENQSPKLSKFYGFYRVDPIGPVEHVSIPLRLQQIVKGMTVEDAERTKEWNEAMPPITFMPKDF
jgi:hypothetical protein